MLSDKEKKELKDLANSPNLKEDLRKISKNRHNPFVINGEISLDRLLIFLTEYNYFINHATRQVNRIKDKLNKL